MIMKLIQLKVQMKFRLLMITFFCLGLGVIFHLKNSNPSAPLLQIWDRVLRPVVKSPWPPKNVKDLFDSETESYDLTIPVQIIQTNQSEDSSDALQTYAKYLRHLHGNVNSSLSDLENLYKWDRKTHLGSGWRGAGENFDLYPSVVNLGRIIEAIKLGNPISVVPINNPELHAYRVPKSVCDHQDREHEEEEENPIPKYDLIVMIKSCSYCFRNRQTIRQTFMQSQLWVNFTIGFTFVIGIPVESGIQEFHMDGFDVKFPETSWTMMDANKDDRNRSASIRALFDESQKFGDLLIGSFTDTYYNLTLKLMTAFRWATAFCHDRTHLFMYMDDDYALIPKNLIQFVNSIPKELRSNYAGGREDWNYAIKRPNQDSTHNRHSISWAEMPFETYPPYPLGIGYFIGSRFLHDAAVGSAFVKYLRFDDTYIGFIAHKMRQKFNRIPGILPVRDQIGNRNEVICATMESVNKVFNWTAGAFFN